LASRKVKHKTAGAKLRKLGLLPQGYKLDALTKNQKDRIRKLEHQYQQVLAHPSHYAVRPVSRETAKGLRKTAFHVTTRPGRAPVAIIFKRENQTVEIERKRVVHRHSYIGHHGERVDVKAVTKLQEYEGDIFEQAQAFFKRKRPGQYLMLRNNGFAPYNVAIHSMRSFMEYMRQFEKMLNAQPSRRTGKPLTNPTRFERVAENLTVVTGYSTAEALRDFDAGYDEEEEDAPPKKRKTKARGLRH
jgi:hypothetical protein